MAFIEERLEKYERFKFLHAKQVEGRPIKINYNGVEIIVDSPIHSSPFQIAVKIEKDEALKTELGSVLEQKPCVAKINGKLWDIHEPISEEGTLEFLHFDSPEGKEVFFHSSAHILGATFEALYQGLVVVGPASESGFFYDVYLPDDEQGNKRTLSESDLPLIQKKYQSIANSDSKFEHIFVTKLEAMELFSYNKFKLEFLENHVEKDDDLVKVYKNGDFIDFCRGPHLPTTKYVVAPWLNKVAGTHLHGDITKEPLQRVYGISFPTKNELKDHKTFVEEAKKRDHRLIGEKQELFFFSPIYSAGCPFFLPHGQRIYLTLQNFVRKLWHKRGYLEVQTPNMASHRLWRVSGHWDHYHEDMFQVVTEDMNPEDDERDIWALAPMNCPKHCLCFASRIRSYRELPLRYGEFGVLHRNEASGALNGLFRVRRFVQDDGHIYCRRDQIFEEIEAVLDMMRVVYSAFDMEYTFALSTKPENCVGSDELWAQAEEALQNALDNSNINYTINPGDGAFYGPKIDVYLRDALNRKHQCATIQLDFNMPEKFNLKYKDADGNMVTPVMIHRAVFGSMERFIGMITEHLAGRWPFWLSPRQAIVVPVDPLYNEYAEKCGEKLRDAGFYVDVDVSNNRYPKKVRNASSNAYNYILTVGQQEVDENGILPARRAAKGTIKEEMVSIDELIETFHKYVDEMVLDR
eukprot:TRINITY_DN3121_c5_g1_i1.p1 TRINITY_DN3121_c5_g1~~TRINITY_DN3121_c5_g1_i1.p1  ORF type:complete len:710 (-),score=220.98 TRINITY_DN3121_c5_g1_i1:13-2088(-)